MRKEGSLLYFQPIDDDFENVLPYNALTCIGKSSSEPGIVVLMFRTGDDGKGRVNYKIHESWEKADRLIRLWDEENSIHDTQ